MLRHAKTNAPTARTRRLCAHRAINAINAALEPLEGRALLAAVSLWDDTTVPSVAAFPDPDSVEVGVKIRSDEDGFITGVQFYKGAGNTGTHLGNLWTADGTLLASATFTSETETGWQHVNFASPVPISADTTYIASYFAPAGRYAVDVGYFTGGGVDNPPLHALQHGVDGGNGIFAYSPVSVFPGNSADGNNYWVDVVFDAEAEFTPAVSAVSPADLSDDVPIASNVKVTFNGPMDGATINSTTVLLRDESAVNVPAAVTYDAATRTATLNPNADLALDEQYTVVVVGGPAGALASNGTGLAGNFTSTFRTSETAAFSIWNDSVTPAVAAFADGASVEVGVRFRSDVVGFIQGVRFYKGTGNTGTHIGNLWATDGTLLASATFTDETETGWQQVAFAEPVAIAADTTYIASYFAPVGHYAVDVGYFTADVSNGTLHALQNGVDGGNGIFMYSPVSVFPGNSADGNNYWVDPVFSPPPPPEPEPEPDDPPAAQPQSVSVSEDGSAEIALAGSDDVTAANALTFTIQSLPALGVLKHNGIAATAGQTFVGSPSGLTYEPGAEQEGGAADAFDFTVTDGAGQVSDVATVSIDIVKAVADGAVVLGSDGVLRVGGTPGLDVISISRTSGGNFRVMFGLTVVSNTVPVSAVSEIRVWGRGGHDGIALIDVSTRSMLSGGAGTDVIVGGHGADVMVGGLGDDALTGLGGDDVIVGGDGRDALLGMAGHDVLIAGGLGVPISARDLRALGAEWAANKTVTADEAAAAEEVFTDDDTDLLTGGSGSDWFIVSLRDWVLDFTRIGTNKDAITYV